MPTKKTSKTVAETNPFLDPQTREKMGLKSDFDAIKRCADELKQEISKSFDVPEQLVFSFMPSQMTRTSPFFPLPRQHKQKRLQEPLVWENVWGKIEIDGYQLSVRDESALLALLHLVAKQSSATVRTTRHELVKLLGHTPSKSTYKALWGSLRRLVRTYFSIEVWDQSKKTKSPTIEAESTLINFHYSSQLTNKLEIEVNRFFLQTLATGFCTGIDFRFRLGLRGDTSKALYRFLLSQKPFMGPAGKYSIGLDKLCAGVNLDLNQKITYLRKTVRRSLKELRRSGFVSRWQINKNDVVSIWRGERAKIEK